MFQSTHSLRSATDSFRESGIKFCSFNPRTPCGVRRKTLRRAAKRCMFQSTHSLRSATHTISFMFYTVKFQSTHSLRSATGFPEARSPWLPVSIHALLAECDQSFMNLGALDVWFQSTHSLRSATGQSAKRRAMEAVSIHALLAECDSRIIRDIVLIFSFNPRTPCGVRLEVLNTSLSEPVFQSTHSLRSATPS